MQHADLPKESQSSTPRMYHSAGNIPTLLSDKASEKKRKKHYHFFSSTLSEDQTGGQVVGGGRGWGGVDERSVACTSKLMRAKQAAGLSIKPETELTGKPIINSIF